jgi:DNA-binding NtrC family response regulator
MKQPIQILVVDTDLNTLGLCKALRAQGLSASIRQSDSACAMDHFTNDPPDLAVVEIVMPETDGIELLMAIKQHHPITKVIAISGGGVCLPRETVLYWASRLGADAVLPKPFDITKLEHALHTVFGEQAQARETED